MKVVSAAIARMSGGLAYYCSPRQAGSHIRAHCGSYYYDVVVELEAVVAHMYVVPALKARRVVLLAERQGYMHHAASKEAAHCDTLEEAEVQSPAVLTAEGNPDLLTAERTLVLSVVEGALALLAAEGALVLLAAEGSPAPLMVDGNGLLYQKFEQVVVVAVAWDNWVGSSFGDTVLLPEEGRADMELGEVGEEEGGDMMAAVPVLGMNWNWEGILELNMPLD
jgi:hypothetical protein